MIFTCYVLITLIILVPQNYGQFVQQFRPFTPAIAPYPPPCKPEQVLVQAPPILQQQMIHTQPSQQIPVQHKLSQHIPIQHQAIQQESLSPLPIIGDSKDLGNSFSSKNSSEALSFILPFMDINIEIQRRVHIMQESISTDIFILHGHELFQLFLARHEKRLSLMCYLEGSVRILEPKAAEVIYWEGHLVLVVALDEHLEIYQIRRDLLQSRAEVLKEPTGMHDMAPVFPAVQQLTMRGKLQKLFVFSPGENQLMIVVVVNFSKLYGKIRTFVKTKDYFEPMEEMTTSAIQFMNIIGSKAKYLITGKFIKNKTKTTLSIYEINTMTLQLGIKQSLTVDSLVVHSLSIRHENLIIACSAKQDRCQSYLQMANGTFEGFKERTSQELAFNQIVANSKFILASRQNEILVFTDHFLDCYGGFKPDMQEISQVMGHYNQRGENFVLVLHKTPFRVLIRTVQMEVNEKLRKSRATRDGVSSLSTQHKLILKSLVDRARSFLPPRKEDMNIFHHIADVILPQSNRFEPEKPSNPFEQFMQTLVPKKEEPEEIDLIDMFESIFTETSREPKSKMDFFAIMDDIVKTEARESAYKDPYTDLFETFFGVMRPKRKVLASEEPLQLKFGKVKKIKIQNPVLKSPKEILDRITEIRRNFLGSSRGKRSDRDQDGGPNNLTLELNNNLKVNKLKVTNLIYNKEVIKGVTLKLTPSNSTQLMVKSKATAHRVNASAIQYPEQKRAIRQFVPDLYYDLSPSTAKKHLQVSTINGLRWKDFYDDIFWKSRDSTITGRLVLQSKVNVVHLKTTRLNDIVVDQLFNLRQPQIIQSDLVISRFFVHELEAERVNGLKFEDDIVFSGRDAHVESPVTMHHLSISGDLVVADKKIERFSENSDEMKFKQFYTNKVVINGTLVLNNLQRENGNQTKIVIDGQEFKEHEIKQQYLLKDEKQHFDYPVVFDNSKVIAPQLDTKYLNDHLAQDHMLTDKVNNSKPLYIVFMNTVVKGDIICRDYKSKLADIQENLIRPGDVVKISGLKRFEAPVATDELESAKLNHLDFNDFILKTDLMAPLRFKDSKQFNTISVRNPSFVEKAIDAMYLNNLPLEDLLNHDYHMDRLYVSHTLLVSNMVFHKINGIPFDEFFTKLGVRNNQLILHKDLIVEGNVVFGNPVELEYINDLKWNEYVQNLARTNGKAVIEGDVSIHGDLAISEDLWANEVNGYNLEDIFQNILSKTKPQVITGHYTFDNLKGSNVDLFTLNGRQAKDYIDLSSNFLEMKGNLIAPKIVVKGSLRGIIEQPYNFDNLSKSIEKIPLRRWHSIYVMENATCSQDQVDKYIIQEELLKYLFKNAVRSNENQKISGNVKLIRPIIENMSTRLQFPSNVDFKFIEKDAVLKNSTNVQHVKGVKNFSKTVYTNNLEIQNEFKTQLLNNIDIPRFNKSLYRLSSKRPVEGALNFHQPLNVGHLVLKGLINGLNSSLIYEIKNNSILPPVAIDNLLIAQDINIKTINHMSLQYFLDNRVTLRGPALEIFGIIQFENLVIEKNALLQSINNITIDNLVLRHSSTLQTLTGHKSVLGYFELAGPAHVMHLNGKDLIELYRNTLFSDQDYDFDSLATDKATFDKGLEMMDDNMRQRSFSDLEKEKKIHFQKFIENLDQNMTAIAGNILYLDYDWNAQVIWDKPKNISMDMISVTEVSRISFCERQLMKISFSMQNQVVYLEKITSNRLSTLSDNLSVKVENYCKFKNGKVKSKISLSAPKLLRVFGLKRFVETIDILSSNNLYNRYVIIHALDLPTLKRNEVRIFKYDSRNNSIQDWQGLTQNIGEKLKVFQQSISSHVLVTNGLANNHPALTIYQFDITLEKFKLHQIIDGDYDVIEMLQLHNNTYTQLIITCRKCQRIYIYELNYNHQPNYQIFQIISLNSNIDKLFMFKIRNDNYMFVLSENESGYYYLYKYSYIRGWVQVSYGFFPKLQTAVPLMEIWSKDNSLKLSDIYDSLPLVLLCNIDNCHIVNAVIQK